MRSIQLNGAELGGSLGKNRRDPSILFSSRQKTILRLFLSFLLYIFPPSHPPPLPSSLFPLQHFYLTFLTACTYRLLTASAILLPFFCHSLAILLPFSCHSLAILLPFSCHFWPGPSSSFLFHFFFFFFFFPLSFSFFFFLSFRDCVPLHGALFFQGGTPAIFISLFQDLSPLLPSSYPLPPSPSHPKPTGTRERNTGRESGGMATLFPTAGGGGSVIRRIVFSAGCGR